MTLSFRMEAGLRTHRFNIIAVRIEQECRVVSWAVIAAMSGCAIVAAAGLQALGVKRLDRGMILGAECEMRARAVQPLVEVKPQCRFALRAETRTALVL